MEGGYNSYQNGTDRKDFNQIAQNIGSNIQKISQNVVSMKKMVNSIGTSQDTQELRTKLGKTKMQKERLADEFMTALNAFQQTQQLALEKEKKDIAQKRVTSRLPPPPSKLSSHGDQLIELTPSSQQTQAQLQQEELDTRLLEQQHAAMVQLEEDIGKVNDIFKELGNLVHNQGEIIDSIEANVESANVYVSDAASHLREANRLKTKLRKHKCLLLLIPLTFLICLIIFLSWSN